MKPCSREPSLEDVLNKCYLLLFDLLLLSCPQRWDLIGLGVQPRYREFENLPPDDSNTQQGTPVVHCLEEVGWVSNVTIAKKQMIPGCFLVNICLQPYTIQVIKRCSVNTTVSLILQKS